MVPEGYDFGHPRGPNSHKSGYLWLKFMRCLRAT